MAKIFISKKYFALLLFVILTTLWGIYMATSKHTVEAKDIRVLSHVYERGRVLDPSKVRFAGEYIYLENLTVRLIEFGNNGEYQNQLADKITFKNDKKDIYISIKEAYFNDGSRITATDVVQTIKRAILRGSPHTDPKNVFRDAKNLKSLDQEISGVKVIDDNTLFIGLNSKMKEIFYYLQLADYGILHPNQYMKNGDLTTDDWSKYSSGAYLLSYSIDGVVTFAANPRSLAYHKKMPQNVIPVKTEDDKVVDEIKNSKVHFGDIISNNYEKNKEALHSLSNISLYGDKFNAITYLVLNIRSGKFKDNKIRQWVQKKILESFVVKDDEKDYTKKATQYFLVGAKGYVSDAQTVKLLDHVDTSQVPSELKEGIKIRTVVGMEKYIPENFDKSLSEAMGIPVIITFDVQPQKYIEIWEKRDFDIFLASAYMSYKVLSESLNLVFTVDNPKALDPTGKVKNLLSEYQKEDDSSKEEKIINQILQQIIVDAEIVPVIYSMDPTFYNKEVIDISDANIYESMQFWKLRMR